MGMSHRSSDLSGTRVCLSPFLVLQFMILQSSLRIGGCWGGGGGGYCLRFSELSDWRLPGSIESNQHMISVIPIYQKSSKDLFPKPYMK
jgi:hypothetical protein